MTPNRLDKIIGYFNPAAELRRISARARIRAAYEGAKTGRRTAGWLTSGNSANAEIGADLARLRERSRDLTRNHHYAAKAAYEWPTKIVGAGILARFDSPMIQTAWDAWRLQCSADGLPHFEAVQWLVARTVFESGECLVRFRPRSSRDGITPPLQLQVLEPDYLDHTKTGGSDGNVIIHGVEFDKIGRRVGYWLYGQHPGEVVSTGTRGGLSLQSQFTPASQVLHIYEATRPGQVRGVPALAPVMLAMRDLDDWLDSEITRKKTEACLAGFIISPEGEAVALTTQTTDAAGNAVESFEPGMIVRLKPGEDVKLNQPAHAGGIAEAERLYARKIAAGVHIPYEILTGDLSQTNYSSYRSGLLCYRDRVTAYQWNTLIPLLCEPVKDEFLRVFSIGGGAQSVSATWAPPAFDLLDRETEAKADQLELSIGTLTWPQAVARRGEDPEKQLTEIERFAKRLEAAGISFEKGGSNGQQQAPATAQ